MEGLPEVQPCRRYQRVDTRGCWHQVDADSAEFLQTTLQKLVSNIPRI